MPFLHLLLLIVRVCMCFCACMHVTMGNSKVWKLRTRLALVVLFCTSCRSCSLFWDDADTASPHKLLGDVDDGEGNLF